MDKLSNYEQYRLDQYRERAYDHNKFPAFNIDYDELNHHVGRYIVNIHEMRTIGRISQVGALVRDAKSGRNMVNVTLSDGTIVPFSFSDTIFVSDDKVESIYYRNELQEIKKLLAGEEY